MTAVRSFEQDLLAGAETLLSRARQETGQTAAAGRLEILEAAACRRGGIDLADYRTTFAEQFILHANEAQLWGDKVLGLIRDLPIPTPLALASLAHPGLARGEQRRAGAYYTDFRLAGYVASRLASHLRPGMKVIDPAAGSGILLTALTLEAADGDPHRAAGFIRGSIFAADRSPLALRATRLALSSTTDDLAAVRDLDRRLVCRDSLLISAEEWEQLVPGGFDAVIGNPPWEKLKVTRHELLAAAGVMRHYGAVYDHEVDLTAAWTHERQRMLGYLDELATTAELQGSGEADLYKLFLELGCRLLCPGGHLAMLVPAGLIRSQGTEALRRFLLDHAPQLELTVLENRARFFAIDTRFKFLAVHARMGDRRSHPLVLRHGSGSQQGVRETASVRIARSKLAQLRRDLTIPEVRGAGEWDLFRRMSEAGQPFGDPLGAWQPQLVREVDMTRDHAHFRRAPAPGYLPLLEGRMIHHFRACAKAYVSGTGRAARWDPLPPTEAAIRPQFWYPANQLRPAVGARTRRVRAGFCDVTGQTNERTLLAAVVPADVVCGNKVPTVTFGRPATDQDDHPLIYLWVALMNSLPVDWLARRVTTTTVNYFLLLSLPLPPIAVDSATGKRLATLAKELTKFEAAAGQVDSWAIAETRVEIDLLVADAYKLTPEDLGLILEDFPLLDRGQPPLLGEVRSTVTRDLVLARARQCARADDGIWTNRLERARNLGACAYIPAEYAKVRLSTGRGEGHDSRQRDDAPRSAHPVPGGAAWHEAQAPGAVERRTKRRRRS